MTSASGDAFLWLIVTLKGIVEVIVVAGLIISVNKKDLPPVFFSCTIKADL